MQHYIFFDSVLQESFLQYNETKNEESEYFQIYKDKLLSEIKKLSDALLTQHIEMVGIYEESINSKARYDSLESYRWNVEDALKRVKYYISKQEILKKHKEFKESAMSMVMSCIIFSKFC